MKRTTSKRVAMLGSAAAAAAFSVALIQVSGAQATTAEQSAAIQGILDTGDATLLGESEIEIRYFTPSDEVFSAIANADMQGALEDWTLTMKPKGVEVSGESAARSDAADPILTGSIAPNCPESPSDVAAPTSPSLKLSSCDLTAGSTTTSPVTPTQGAPLISVSNVDSLTRAIIRKHVPDVTFSNSVVATAQNIDGRVSVDFNNSFADLVGPLREYEQYSIDRDIWMSLFASSDAASLDLSVNGDCLSYAIAVGGDACAPRSRTFIEP